jgi:secreted trypsin-like serine protease
VSFSVTTRRSGENVVNSISYEGATSILFRMDFDNPSTTGKIGGSLGNRLESTICAGDSGGPSFVLCEDGEYRIAGINSFGSGTGYFGDSIGGPLVSSVKDWIESYADEWSKADLNASVDGWFSSP